MVRTQILVQMWGPRLFTVPYFFVRSFRCTMSYRHGYILIFKCTEGAGVGDYSSGGGRRKIEGL